MANSLIERTLEQYSAAPLAQNTIKSFLDRNKLTSGSEGNIAEQMAVALAQENVVTAVMNHSYKPAENDDQNLKYVKAAKKLELVVARNFCRVAHFAANPDGCDYSTNQITALAQQYYGEVLGKLREQSLDSAKFLHLMEETRDELQKQERELSPKEARLRRIVGIKVEYGPAQGQALWDQNIDTPEVKMHCKIAEHEAIQIYSKIMRPLMITLGETAYESMSSTRVKQVADALRIPEVISFLGQCNRSIMADTFPRIIAVIAAQENGIQKLREYVPTILPELERRWRETEKKFGF